MMPASHRKKTVLCNVCFYTDLFLHGLPVLRTFLYWCGFQYWCLCGRGNGFAPLLIQKSFRTKYYCCSLWGFAFSLLFSSYYHYFFFFFSWLFFFSVSGDILLEFGCCSTSGTPALDTTSRALRLTFSLRLVLRFAFSSSYASAPKKLHPQQGFELT